MAGTLNRIPLIPAAWALSATLVATFIVCAGFELVWPDLPVAHGWVEGIIGSIAFGWFLAAIVAWVFNALASH